MIEPSSKEWDKALSNAPDYHEVHTVFRRYMTIVEGKERPRQRVVGRRIVANGSVLYEEMEKYPSLVS